MVSEDVSKHGWNICIFSGHHSDGSWCCAGEEPNESPISVMNFLQDVAKTVVEEGKQEVALYQNFECNCPSTSQEFETKRLEMPEDCDQGVLRVACRSEAGFRQIRSSGCEAASASHIGSTIRKVALSAEKVSESVRSTLLTLRSNSNTDHKAERSLVF